MNNRTSYLSFYARIKTKTVLDSFKDSLQTYGSFFQFSFSFSIEVRFRWVAELFQFPIQNLRWKENEKEIEKTYLTFVRNLSRIPELSLFLF